MFGAEPIALSELAEALVGGGAGAVGAALVAGVFGIYRIAAGRKDDERERLRGLYSEAYKTGLEWCEAVYRVRRRASDGAEDRALVARLHELQERIVYYEGWLSMEAPELGKAYTRFVGAVKGSCEPLIQQAWGNDGREPTVGTPPDEPQPEVGAAREQFVKDVREHLSRQPSTRKALKKRYGKETT